MENMSRSGWEVVNRKKGRGDGSKKDVKSQKKLSENMPKLEQVVTPIQESQTMFDAFIDKHRKKMQQQNETKVNGVSGGKAKNKENSSQQKKKHPEKKKNQPQAKPVPLEEAVKTLDAEEMKNRFAAGEARFPDSPMFWLQDLASFMNLKLDIELTDPVFSSKPVDYPASLLSSEINDLLLSAFNRCSTQTLERFFEFCLLSMSHDSVKGLNTIGYRICLQCLAQEKPSIVAAAIPKSIELRNSNQNRQNVCLSILWAIGQAGYKNLEVGIRVWVDVMFPVLRTRAFSKFVVEYLDTLLSCHKSKKLSKPVLGVKELFPIFDCIYSPVGLSANLQKQLVTLYPRLKTLSYGAEPAKILRSFFPSYLRRLEPSCSPPMESEVLSSLVECLTVDNLSYSVWRQFYTKHLVQSSILISHLHDTWDRLPSTFPRKLLHETLCAFQVTNEELKSQGKGTQDIENCVNACTALINKMNAHRFPWAKVLFTLIVVVSALLAYDVQQHGSFRSSKTGELLKNAGVLAICEQAWGKITIYTGKAVRWLEVNIPVFSSWVCTTFGPYFQLFWDKLFALAIYLWESTECIRTWANANIPPILKQLSDSLPGYAKMLSKSTEGLFLNVITFMHTVYKFVEYYSSAVVAWLHQHIFTGSLSAENLQKYAGDAVEVFQQYTLTTYNWISKNIATVVYPGK